MLTNSFSCYVSINHGLSSSELFFFSKKKKFVSFAILFTMRKLSARKNRKSHLLSIDFLTAVSCKMAAFLLKSFN